MGARTGAQYLAGLKSRPRDVWIRGRKAGDVTTHPAFATPAAHIAKLYDMQHDPAHRDVLTYVSPSTGDRVGMAFMMSKTVDDLRRRRQAFQLWAETSFGLLGRSPDFLNTTWRSPNHPACSRKWAPASRRTCATITNTCARTTFS